MLEAMARCTREKERPDVASLVSLFQNYVFPLGSMLRIRSRIKLCTDRYRAPCAKQAVQVSQNDCGTSTGHLALDRRRANCFTPFSLSLISSPNSL